MSPDSGARVPSAPSQEANATAASMVGTPDGGTGSSPRKNANSAHRSTKNEQKNLSPSVCVRVTWPVTATRTGMLGGRVSPDARSGTSGKKLPEAVIVTEPPIPRGGGGSASVSAGLTSALLMCGWFGAVGAAASLHAPSAMM